jgi:lysozyme|tara:strand:- start:24 stop:452 length:429 start_codon:yes stop_codon:yes gene_type:complete
MVREKLLDMLMLHEGLELKPYQCTADKTTIGVGRNLQDVGITEDEAKYLLQNDIDRILKEVEHWSFLEKLNEPRQAVILDMVFNMGVTRFNANTWVKTFAAIQNEEWEKAANEMLDSKWAKQVGQRAIRLSQMMRKGEWYES